MRKAPGHYGRSNWLLRECIDQLVEKIQKLIQYSIKEGKIPLDWMSGNLVAICKERSIEEPTNQRPVSLIILVGKLCETATEDREVKYLEELNVFTGHQFGYM